MEILSLVGIILGILFFIFCCFRGIQLFLSALLASLIIILFSGMPVLDTLTGIWSESVGGFITNYILVIVAGCLYGQTMVDGKGSRCMTVVFAGFIRKSKKNQKFIAVLFVPAIYMLLTYVGVSGFVIVFTVLYTARDLYQELNIPWRFYCYGGACSVISCILPGSLQLTNIQLSEMFGTSLTAAPLLGGIGFAAFIVVFLLLVKRDIRQAERTGETFMDTGSAFANPDIGKDTGEEELPNALLALISMAAVTICAMLFHVLIGMLAGILLNLIFFRKYITKPKETLAAGVNASFGPSLNGATAVGLSGLIAAVPGFSIITNALSSLPALCAGPLLIALVSFLTTAPQGALSAFGPQILSSMGAAGFSPVVTHRLLTAATLSSVGPQATGVVNTTTLAKIPYRKAVAVYLRMSLIPGLAAVLVMILAIQFGIDS